jgi:hypothetical protein
MHRPACLAFLRCCVPSHDVGTSKPEEERCRYAMPMALSISTAPRPTTSSLPRNLNPFVLVKKVLSLVRSGFRFVRIPIAPLPHHSHLARLRRCCATVRTDNQVLASIKALNISDVDAFVDGFNEALGQLARSSEYSCVNGCESCFPDDSGNTLCGIWETRQVMSVVNRPGNFTLEQILSRNITVDDTIALVSNATFAFDNCISYTIHQSGTLCVAVDLNSIPVEGQDQPCTITYNDVACNSCLITGDQACFVADCTNVDTGDQIDSCAAESLEGPFVFLRYLSDGFGNTTGNATITRGRCDVPSVTAPTPVRTAPSPASVPAPASAAASAPRWHLDFFSSGVLMGLILLLY